MDFEKHSYRLAIARLMMQVEEERIARQESLSGSPSKVGPAQPTPQQIDERILELTGESK